MLIDEQLQEIEEYRTDRGQFPWKDIPGDTYQEHVGLLISEVRQQRATLTTANEEIARLLRAIYAIERERPRQGLYAGGETFYAFANRLQGIARAALHQAPPKGE